MVEPQQATEVATPDVVTQEVDSREIACDGGNGPLGHPRVFLHMDSTNQVDCPYCGRRFVLSANAPATAGH